MKEYDQQKWVDLYRTAVFELKRAAMTGRISDARGEIATRLESLKKHPELHQDEYQAINDALNGLRVLEREEARLAAEDKKRLLEEATRKLQTIALKFQESDPQENSSGG
jgi:hypothetical protein